MEVIPQVICGNRTKENINGFLLELSKNGINRVIIQNGYYEDEDSRTNIACAHKKCVIHAMDNDWPYAIIMEDDVLFTHPKSYEYFLDSMKYLPKDWDIYTSAFYSTMTFDEDYMNIYRIKGFAGLQCYAVNKRFFQTFLTCPPKQNIDQWSSKPGMGACFVCHPFAAIQKPGFSENVNEYKDYSSLLIGKKIYMGV